MRGWGSYAALAVLGAMLVWLGLAQLDAAVAHNAGLPQALTALVALLPGLLFVGLAVGAFRSAREVKTFLDRSASGAKPAMQAVVIPFRPRPRQ